jgi:uncharacterized protein (TIGR04141 family)
VGQFSGGAYDGVSVAIPELETTRIAQFAICKGHAGRNVQDLRIDDVVEALGEVTDGAFSLDGVYVKALSADRQPLGRYDLRQCLVAESSVVSSAESVHILSLGKWHKVKTDFVAEINSEVARIERIQDPTYLPVCGDGWEEGRYNKEIVPIYKDYVCFDCDDFRQGLGHSAIEVCDLYSNERHLICVKRYHSSQTLSHLFAQGSVSAHFLRSSREYREFLYSKAGTTGLFDVNDIDKTPFTVVYAIVMDWDKSVPDDIPFFSKVNLLDHVRNIRGLGFDLRLHHIPLVPAPGWNADKRKKRKKKVKAGGATSN